MYFKKLIFIILALGFSVFSCNKGKLNPKACNGDTRRAVKILTDEAANNVDLNPTLITIAELGNIPVPEVKSETPRQSVELKTYTVTAKVDKVKKEWDGDYHVRLTDGTNYLITEAANPGCSYAKESSFYSSYVTVQNFIKNNDLEGKYVTITGVAFVDIDHHYKRKQAKNNMELHPILNISF